MRSTFQPLADKPPGTVNQASANDWADYRLQADRVDRFTRWMLERTLAALEAFSSDESGDLHARTITAIEQALLQRPVAPPKPVDSRVDLLVLELTAEQTTHVLAALDDTANVELDRLQTQRVNPWGGFREAWLEHYNQVRD